MATTCRATIALKPSPVSAVELMDRAALRSVQDKPGMPESLRTLPDGAAALLIDVRGHDEAELESRMAEVQASLEGIRTLEPVTFTREAATYELYWKIRKGLFPAVGAVRDTGTTVIIEDVAFPIERLDEGVLALTDVFHRHGYPETILFGHALEGNLHFVFPQGFEKPGEVERYQALMDEVAQLVGVEYGGSLKAEHGTGRNMAPYVELEWGPEAYALMWEIKALFDPENLLNPEVILSRNPTLHLENLKPLPAAHEIVDKCIECGFCEHVCPSKDLDHGTGRNMAPYVELEWGPEAYALMWEIKALFDPENLLNPEVILSRNPTLHLENLKPLPAAHEIVDKCIECGFCEHVCPSKDLTLTPRQRIVIAREMARLEALGEAASGEEVERLAALRAACGYAVDETCAADGLCATQCPVGINTGDLVRELRHERLASRAGLAHRVGRHFSGVTRMARGALSVAGAANRVLGDDLMEKASGSARRLSGGCLPQWTPALPQAARSEERR